MKKENESLFDKAYLEYCVSNKDIVKKSNEGYLGKNVFKVKLNDGTLKNIEQITKNGGNGDAVVIIPKIDNNFIMIVQSRPVTFDEVLIEFPAGMVDLGEEPIESAKRELIEETGFKANKLDLLEWHYQDQGCSNAKIYTYLATDLEKVTNSIGVDNERILPIKVDSSELNDLLKNDSKYSVKDANTKIAIYSYFSLKENI